MNQKTNASPPSTDYRIDTDEALTIESTLTKRRAVVKALTDALYNYLELPIAEMERALIAQQMPRVKIEDIVYSQQDLEDRKGRLEAAHAKVEETLLTLSEDMRPMIRVQLEALLVSPLEQEISVMERLLSQMQAEFEKGNAPAEGG